MSLDWYLECDHCHSTLYDANITHNVSPMWTAAGCYGPLYDDETWEGRLGKEALAVLRAGVIAMEDSPEKFREMNPPNGWGDYEGALEWLRAAVAACAKYPEGKIRISR